MNEMIPASDLPGYRDWFEVVRTYAACERVLTERCAAAGLTLAQHDVLAVLLREGAQRQNRLAERLFVTKSNVTALLSRMERDGLIERTPDPDDARAKRVSPTLEGRVRAEAAMAAQEEVARGMIAQLTEAERTAMGEMMRRVRAFLEGA